MHHDEAASHTPRGPEGDEYVTGVYRWWHLDGPSPELLEAEADGWLAGAVTAPASVAVDLGCGLGSEARYLAGRGWRCLGVDVSAAALAGASAARGGGEVTWLRADVTALPVADASVDALLDRGCFHYLDASGRRDYVAEAARVLRPSGRLLLRACLRSGDRANHVDEALIATCFRTWRVRRLRGVNLPSDTRQMPALEVRLEPPP